MAALDARRPTRDIDFAARAVDNSVEQISAVVRRIAGISLDDGVEFDSDNATAEVVREQDDYSGIRVTLRGTLSRAVIRFHVDVNVGDPIWPEPQQVSLPRLLEGVLIVRGYPLEMVLAEKIVTAIARGTANTRWRDFVDIYALVQRHAIDGATLRQSLFRVAQYRDVTLVSLKSVLTDYAEIAQQRWFAWLRKHRIESIPNEFSTVLDLVGLFADPIILDKTFVGSWDPARRLWG